MAKAGLKPGLLAPNLTFLAPTSVQIERTGYLLSVNLQKDVMVTVLGIEQEELHNTIQMPS